MDQHAVARTATCPSWREDGVAYLCAGNDTTGYERSDEGLSLQYRYTAQVSIQQAVDDGQASRMQEGGKTHALVGCWTAKHTARVSAQRGSTRRREYSQVSAAFKSCAEAIANDQNEALASSSRDDQELP